MQTLGPVRPFARAVMRFLAVAGVAATLAPGTADALFVVNQPWVRPAAAGGATEAYMVLRSSEGTTLVGIRSDLVSGITLEEPDSARHGKFRAVTRLPLPAGETVTLAPGRVHGHLAPIKRSLKLGERVVLVLTLEAADGTTQEIPVDAEVRHHSPSDDEMRAHGHPAPRATPH
jgi:periplasmic copper chaperone A